MINRFEYNRLLSELEESYEIGELLVVVCGLVVFHLDDDYWSYGLFGGVRTSYLEY
jgi:hypothetical protein